MGDGMLGWRGQKNVRDVLAAISASQAVIEFDLNGNVLSANENFCKALGYAASEIVGKHHSMFCDPAEVSSAAYREF